MPYEYSLIRGPKLYYVVPGAALAAGGVAGLLGAGLLAATGVGLVALLATAAASGVVIETFKSPPSGVPVPPNAPLPSPPSKDAALNYASSPAVLHGLHTWGWNGASWIYLGKYSGAPSAFLAAAPYPWAYLVPRTDETTPLTRSDMQNYVAPLDGWQYASEPHPPYLNSVGWQHIDGSSPAYIVDADLGAIAFMIWMHP